MTYDYQIGDGAHALDPQEFIDWKRGYQVVNAAGGSNLVDDNATSDLVIRAAAGDINAGGTTVTCTQDTIDLSGDVDPDDPRKVTVYRTPAGALATSAGTPEPAQDTGESRRNAYRPSPPTLSGTDGVVLATVWLPAGASSVTNADIRDRRLPAELPLAEMSFADLGSDPAANGELQRNGTDLKAYSGGAVRNLSNIGSGGQDTATIDDTDSPFTTSDEAVVYADTSTGAVTVTLSSADAALGNEIRVVNIDGSNAVTVGTEGSETIDPAAEASKTITEAGWAVAFVSDGSNWDTTLAAEYESVSTGSATIDTHPAIGGVEVGDSSVGTISGAASDGFDDQNNIIDSVTFSSTFSATPKVVTNSSGGQRGIVYAQNESTTGVDLQYVCYSTDNWSNPTGEWVAIGGV